MWPKDHWPRCHQRNWNESAQLRRMLWWLAFCLRVGMFILDVSNVGTSMQDYASLWKISVYFRKLMVFEVPLFFETHSEVLRYRYMIVCLEMYIYLCILDSFAYIIYIYTYMRSSSDCPMIFCSSPFNSFVQGIFQRSLNYPFWRNQAIQLCGNFEGFPV